MGMLLELFGRLGASRCGNKTRQSAGWGLGTAVRYGQVGIREGLNVFTTSGKMGVAEYEGQDWTALRGGGGFGSSSGSRG